MKRLTVALVAASASLVLLCAAVSEAEVRSIQGGTCPFTITGSLMAGDLNESPRLFRADPASTCAAPHACPGPSGTGPYFYDQYVFVNAGASNCVTVTLATACGGATLAHASAYLNSYTPGAGTICNNYIADLGASPLDGDPPKPFSFTAAPGATFVVVVNATVPSAACTSYTLNVTGCEVPVELQSFSVE
jgi:hypothetical protein